MNQKQLAIATAIVAAFAPIGAALSSTKTVQVMIDGSPVPVAIDQIDRNDPNAKHAVGTDENQVNYKVTILEVGDTTFVFHKYGSEEEVAFFKTAAFKTSVELSKKSTEQGAGTSKGRPYLVDLKSLQKAA